MNNKAPENAKLDMEELDEVAGGGLFSEHKHTWEKKHGFNEGGQGYYFEVCTECGERRYSRGIEDARGIIDKMDYRKAWGEHVERIFKDEWEAKICSGRS